MITDCAGHFANLTHNCHVTISKVNEGGACQAKPSSARRPVSIHRAAKLRASVVTVAISVAIWLAGLVIWIIAPAG